MLSVVQNVLEGLPLSSRIMLYLIMASGLACLLTIIGGALLQRRHALAAEPPPLARLDFPTPADQWLACGYAAVMLLFALTSLRAEARTAASVITLGAALFTLAWQAGLYLPLMLRYALLPRTERPRPTWHQYIAWPLTTLGCIYLGVEALQWLGFYDWLIQTTGCAEQQVVVTQFQEGNDLLLRTTLAISAVVIAPITEECCFRGFLYSTLRHWGGATAAAISSAAVFAAVHASLAQFVPLFIFGLAQAIAYEKARSLWLPIAVHALFNAITLFTLICTA